MRYMNKKQKKAPAVFYQEGQWIAIDNGDTVVTLGRKNALEEAWDDVDRRRLVDQGLDVRAVGALRRAGGQGQQG